MWENTPSDDARGGMRERQEYTEEGTEDTAALVRLCALSKRLLIVTARPLPFVDSHWTEIEGDGASHSGTASSEPPATLFRSALRLLLL